LVAAWEALSHAVAWKASTAGTADIGMLPSRSLTRPVPANEPSARYRLSEQSLRRTLGAPFVGRCG
jgi:hypothetical protein